MASGKTENYGLSQWEAADQVVREDFNADNEKLDAAIKNAEEKANTAQKAAEAAYSSENSPFVVGTYKGNGAASRTISLGFTPQAVWVTNSLGQITYHPSSGYTIFFGGLAVTGGNVCRTGEGKTDWINGETVLAIVNGGFKVAYVSKASAVNDIFSNQSGVVYHYIAMK